MAGAWPSTYTMFATEVRSVSRTWHLRSDVEYRGSVAGRQGGSPGAQTAEKNILFVVFVDGRCLMMMRHGACRLSVTCLQRAARVKYPRRQ